MPRLLLPLMGCVLLVALGVGAIMYAQYDDAPGLGLIGFVLIFGAIGLGVRAVLRAKRGV
ncbi:hypothetical protein SAMN04488074_12349 [Lentzea albidocapillata subsp. violacea]|uniref:PEP-CTERM protein-sorting domain-containing protein n=1 Tax=Lentzea albidocapillata subsp. violacea TaxID=128104 RepID=A0A1G9U4W5_9PSEU|nr:hypothetical protein [Lentzea albidocapillata]SDM54928.1 hypothetical protein SAMN04488074_12349 [Lentzea albidocapillata subsp. violacea]